MYNRSRCSRHDAFSEFPLRGERIRKLGLLGVPSEATLSGEVRVLTMTLVANGDFAFHCLQMRQQLQECGDSALAAGLSLATLSV
jgi:hypothetical protein